MILYFCIFVTSNCVYEKETICRVTRWPISEGVGQKNKFVASKPMVLYHQYFINIFCANRFKLGFMAGGGNICTAREGFTFSFKKACLI